MTIGVKANILVGDNRTRLKEIPDQSVQCVVTSPPYWGLRDYGTGTWIGGDESCSHRRDSKKSDLTITGHKNADEMLGVGDAIYKDECPRCGAKREDEQIGLEITPEAYVEELCKVFDEIWRVLKDDGTLWLNLGDTYVGRGSKGDATDPKHAEGRNGQVVALNNKVQGLKTKDLIGIPWRVAFALQARGWYLRQDIVWSKPNPMPESVADRCTKSHEYIFLLTKSPRYYFNNEAIKEKALTGEDDASRNKRDVWVVPVKAYPEAHFAVYPTELIAPCVLAGSKEGDTILDPFSGSGTTGEVALSLGRNYIGTELNPEYAKLSEKRIGDAIGMFGEVSVNGL